VGSLHAADFNICLYVDSLYVLLSENHTCVRVGKSEDHFILFLVIHQQWLMQSIFVENGRILGKSTKGA